MKKRHLLFMLLQVLIGTTMAQAVSQKDDDPLKDSNPTAVEYWKSYLKAKDESILNKDADKYLIARANLDTTNLQYQLAVVESGSRVWGFKKVEDENKWVLEDNYRLFFERVPRLAESQYEADSEELLNIYQLLARTYSYRNEEKAIEFYKKAIFITKKQNDGLNTGWLYGYIASCYRRMNKHQEAYKLLEGALKESGDLEEDEKKELDELLYSELLDHYVEDSLYDQARKLAKRIEKMEKNYDFPSHILAEVYKLTGNTKKALSLLEQDVLEEEANSLFEKERWQNGLLSNDYYKLMHLYLENGNKERAELYGRKGAALLLKKEMPFILLDNDLKDYYEYIHLAIEMRPMEADRFILWLLEEAEDKYNNDALYMAYALLGEMGILRIKDGKFILKYKDVGNGAFNKAVCMNPNRTEAYAFRGLYLARHDKKEEALNMWEKVRSLEHDKSKLRQSELYKILLKKKLIKKL